MNAINPNSFMPTPPPPPRRSLWRMFPLAVTLSLGFVVVVNSILAWAAISSYPGDAVQDDFGTSNRYDQVLEKATRQAALGWGVQASTESGRPVLVLNGPDGKPLEHASITATALRPLGPPQTMHPTFVEAGPGIYRADEVLPQQGNWDLMLRVAVDGKTLSATRRVLLK